MTQPSLNQTFDTSLIDLSQNQDQSSFSTTNSAPSDDYNTMVPQPLPTMGPKFEEASTTGRKMPTRYVPTVDAYDAWASVYDSDGNALQAIDDHELTSGGLLSEFAEMVVDLGRERYAVANADIVDLGCGTGRNTLKLLKYHWPQDAMIKLTGVDASSGMLDVAQDKLWDAHAKLGEHEQRMVQLGLLDHDFLDPKDATLPPIVLKSRKQYEALISTLVLEHFPVHTFFAVLDSLLLPGGLALVTDMHADMGAVSQAGFVSADEKTGQAIKVRGTSWVHTVEETVAEAKKAGFEVVGDVRERAVTEDLINEGVVGERARKWVGTKVWYGVILRKAG